MIKSIPTTDLRLGMYLHKLGGSWLKHPFIRNSFLLTDAKDIKRIIDSGIKDVWIDDEKGEYIAAATQLDLATEVKLNEQDKAVTVETRPPVQPTPQNKRPLSMDVAVEQARKLCSEAKGQVKLMFEEVRLGKAIDTDARDALVNEIATMVDSNSAAILSVARMKTHDDYTYMHSVAVSALMLSLAKQLNLDENVTKLAGIGGLMHDLGKVFMPIDILTKPGKLTDEEYAIMKKHPAAGAKMLQDGDAEAEVIDIALHHHEKMDGSGYPHGLKQEEISVLARMAAICDVYDAVTSNRPYKNPWDPSISIRNMAGWQGHFDKNIFNAFVKTLGIYPVGSLVRLASQHLAVVTEPGIESLLKPTVRVFFSVKLKVPVLIKTIDLAAPGCKDKIESPEDPAHWKFKNLDSFWQ
ncbi:MAG: HD-GYP domain-containing protein [Gammaproteobacteria bacterium]|nr:HD-GYP domain-containing protein [Gammaproteobacteria bacterium]